MRKLFWRQYNKYRERRIHGKMYLGRGSNISPNIYGKKEDQIPDIIEEFDINGKLTNTIKRPESQWFVHPRKFNTVFD